MSEHQATIRWDRGADDFSYEAYSRDHIWEFENGVRSKPRRRQAFADRSTTSILKKPT